MRAGSMAPTRKSRSVNKRISSSNDVSPEKDGVNSNKNKQRKKKLTDKLGSQWSKEELERFYEAYRMYGKDWKKVAGVVRNRTTEMVEALYNMNRAYLSLPEGTASVVGLIAMMTDHYNVLEESDSEMESNDALGSRKFVKRKREKVQLSVSKDQSHSIAASDGCLSLLKKRRLDGIVPHAVGKRTPRVPVSYSYKKDYTENYVSPYRRSLKSTTDANDDEVAHVVALALTEAAQRGGSPQVSQSTCRRAEPKPSPVLRWERKQQLSETARAKLHNLSVDEELLDGSIESRGADNGEYARDNSSLMDMEGTGTVEVLQKGGKFYRKKERVKNVGNHQLDDGGEACSGTEEGLSCSLKEMVDIEVTNEKLEKISPKGGRKRNKKLFFGDETPALNALQTLADLSLMMPISTIDSESSIQLKGDRISADKDSKSALPEETLTSHKRHKLKHSVVPEIEVSTSKKSKLGKESTKDTNVLSESKEQLPFADTTWKRKRKSVVSKVANAKLDSCPSGPLKDEALDDEKKPVVKGKHGDQVFTLPKQLKTVKSSESSLCIDQKETVPTEIPLLNEVSLPTKRSRRKMNLQRTSSAKQKSSDFILKSQANKHTDLKEKLSSCLSSNMVRRWFIFEWFYSAIDYPWFAKRELMEYLNHVGLGNIPRLTRVEWSVVRGSLGKPRRLSEHFLHDERQKLAEYRESVRKHYAELRTGIRDGLPTDLARPLCVGQRVIAIHPKTREIHDGSVLTVDYDKCRIQFDRPELGVEFVMDIDCMPFNPLDNMPEALRRHIDDRKGSFIPIEPHINGNSNFGGCENHSSPLKVHTSSSALVMHGKATVATMDNFCAQAGCVQPCKVTHHQAREADIHALSELKRALDKKETLLMELRSSNSDILENQNGIECLNDSEVFKKHYATVLVELKEASGQVSDAMLQLRQRNTYRGNSLPPWMKPQTGFSVHDDLPSMLDGSLTQELGSTVVQIIKGSRSRAHAMVDAAFKALSLTKEGEDAFVKIGQALDSINHQQLASKSRLPVIRSQEQVNTNGSFCHVNNSTCSVSESIINDPSGAKVHNYSDKFDTELPSDLITSCVATLIMIQTCTERQYPPADVAQILDSAVSSLHPCCPQNLPIYREIQMCMGRIKTQILALIPT
ncbi:protein ALWAYS EARLY 1 isoform X1 [Vigna radiata var. radiata]|uniref:Protein ALWAYS EARLY 1 isoform X1 n=1 Tax=Vigna radiata var. radiata TaxID=3916 RepID=A0A3Q0FE50_VIGRR|nr:protein ALWAYS EARLY 1 isoform X1 [Vigna radiata var. radiata]